MSKKSRKRHKRRTPPPTPTMWQWLTKPWTVIVAVGAVVGTTLLNINPMLANLRNLPAELRTTRDQFSSWYYLDDAWSGLWTNSPEGYVDAAEMGLTNVAIAVDLKVEHGMIGGTISTQQICESVPVFDFLLLQGKVSPTRKSATVVVWDTFLGHNRDIAALRLKRDGVVMTIVPREGAVDLFPSRARIALDPSGVSPTIPACNRKQHYPAQ